MMTVSQARQTKEMSKQAACCAGLDWRRAFLRSRSLVTQAHRWHRRRVPRRKSAARLARSTRRRGWGGQSAACDGADADAPRRALYSGGGHVSSLVQLVTGLLREERTTERKDHLLLRRERRRARGCAALPAPSSCPAPRLREPTSTWCKLAFPPPAKSPPWPPSRSSLPNSLPSRQATD